MVNNSLNRLSYHPFPGQCLLCLAPSQRFSEICSACEDELPWLHSRCRRCSLPMGTPGICGQCLKKAPLFDSSHAAWEYGFPVDRLISDFKYHGNQPVGALLSALAQEELPGRADIDFLLPVPMHWWRRWQRGFNQAEVIAGYWSQAFDIPMMRAKRTQSGKQQQGLSSAQRRKNLRNAFELKKPEMVRGKHIAIVDDVLTTGTTANSLAAILRRAGASTISVWCLARTP